MIVLREADSLLLRIGLALSGKKSVNERPFVDVTDHAWHSQDGRSTYAPAGGFVADKFQGGFFASQNCIECHQTVLKHAQTFRSPRDWYGRVRGSDGIFSVPLHDNSCVSHGGIDLPPRWNQKLIAAGLLVSE